MMASIYIQIAEIDRQIDANHVQLRKLEKIKPMSAASWQRAWDRHPDLQEQERELYVQRGQLQQERDLHEYREAKKAARSARTKPAPTKKCPACGQPVYAPALSTDAKFDALRKALAKGA